MSNSYLLLEDGGRITLEDGSGFLLLEATDSPALPTMILGSGPQRAGTVGSDYYSHRNEGASGLIDIQGGLGG